MLPCRYSGRTPRMAHGGSSQSAAGVPVAKPLLYYIVWSRATVCILCSSCVPARVCTQVGEDSDAMMVDGNEMAGGGEEGGIAAVPSYGVVETYGSSGCFSNGAGGDGGGGGGALAEAAAYPGPAYGAEEQQQQLQQQELQQELQQQQGPGSPGVQEDGEPEGGDRSGGGASGGLAPAEVAAVVGALAGGGGDGADGGGVGGSASALPLSDEAVDAALRLIEVGRGKGSGRWMGWGGAVLGASGRGT